MNSTPFAIERRGRGSKGRPPKQIPKGAEEDLFAEVQRLRAENEYLKKLQALVLEDERHQRKRRAGSSGTKAKHSLDILLSIAQLPRAAFYYHVGVPYQYDLTENCWSGHTESRGIVYDEYTDPCYAIRNNIGYASTALQSNFMAFDLNKARPSVYGAIGAVTVRKSPDAEEALPHRGFPCSI